MPLQDYERRLVSIIEQDPWMVDILYHVKSLDLNDCWVGAGFVRNKVWNTLHNIQTTILNDIDVIYFDRNNLDLNRDQEIEDLLKAKNPDVKWSVKNQARMHLRNDHPPYENCKEALSFWPETATATAVRLTPQNQLELLAPYGLEDLFKLQVRLSPSASIESFNKRIEEKQWKETWNKLIFT